LRRRFNQAALLAQALARELALPVCPDLLQRVRATRVHRGMDPAERRANLRGALRLHPRRAQLVRGARVLLVDDVMTSGATLEAAAHACIAGGAREVLVQTLARVAKSA
jgi:predicted amidophosphoribosyltransferase